MPIYNPEEVAMYSFNPYDYIYPNRKIISRHAVDLVKSLRSEGIRVVVEPRNDPNLDNLEYYFRKGVSDLLTDPVILTLAPIPIGIVSGVVANWISKKFESRTLARKSEAGSQVVFQIQDNGRTVRYAENGRQIN